MSSQQSKPGQQDTEILDTLESDSRPPPTLINSDESSMRNVFTLDMANLRNKVVNSMREYYTSTAENINLILEGRYNNNPSGIPISYFPF
ncbi:hypothetical protein AYI70_g6460 [Smittium culicis]|uniref:Uncharacterized protein n=1 Tax=Smittium culicis TaxID=133412 RepID=A0A1R1XPT9_9FUNG|nr:hypothetical protein AYI70_g6460 [Smittium culicis]